MWPRVGKARGGPCCGGFFVLLCFGVASASSASSSGSATCAPRQLPPLQCCPCELGRAGRHSSCDSSLVSTVGVSFSSGASCAGPTSWYEAAWLGMLPRVGKARGGPCGGGFFVLLCVRVASASSASSSGSATCAPRQLPSLQCCPCELGSAGRHSSCDASLVSTVGVSSP